MITQADKGGGVVVLKKSSYVKEGEYIFGNKEKYTEIIGSKGDSLLKLSRLSCNISAKLLTSKCITQTMFNMATTPAFEFSTTYLLFKVHKPKREDGSIPGRPIISSFQSPFKFLDQYLEFVLSPLTTFIPSKIKNNVKLLSQLTKLSFYPSSAFYSLDVKDLYPSIPHYPAVKAIKYMVTNHHQYLSKILNSFKLKLPSPGFLEFLLLTVLRNCLLTFNGKLYKAKLGIPMGSNISVLVADIYIAHFIEYHLNLHHWNISFYGRFIDDILLFADMKKFNIQTLKNFFHDLSVLEFTSEGPNSSINFLDVTFVIDHANTLQYSPYAKPTAAHSYIHFQSEHPMSMKKGIICSALHTAKALSSNKTTFKNAKETIKNRFLIREYPETFVDEIIYKFENKERNVQSEVENFHRIPLILPYNSKQHKLVRKCFSQFQTKFFQIYNTAPNINNIKPFLVYTIPKTLGNFFAKTRKNI